jgi:hypothetical protein
MATPTDTALEPTAPLLRCGALDSLCSSELIMTQIEYKHVRFVWKLGTQFSPEKFNELLMKMLAEHGREGWDLKGVIYEGGLHAHFIF